MNLSLSDYRQLAAFRHQLRLFLHFSESQAREHGLEPQQHQALLALKGMPEGRRPTIGDLAERLLLRHHTTVELVNRLESAGLVRRRPGTEDRREILLHLTAKGSRKLASLSVAHQEELRIKGPELALALGGFLRQSAPPEVL
ncbi:MAG: MarR family transcriptional regulator [Bryobacterales bacterium]|nr:MarR family transcriptional regulator [Bryobacterales bacterium]